MGNLGDGHVVWDLTDPGITLAQARDALASRLRGLPSLIHGELRQWMANAFADRTLVCRKWRVYEAKPETAERELKLCRLVVELRQQPVTRELCNRIGSVAQGSSQRVQHDKGRTVVYIDYSDRRIDFALKLTLGRLMRVEDAVAYGAYRCEFSVKSAYNIYSAYRACHGTSPKKTDPGHAEPFTDQSPAERDLALQMLTPASKPAPWLPALVDYLKRGGELTQNGLLSVLARALSSDRSVPFYIQIRRGKGHPTDRSLIQRNLDLYYRVGELIQPGLTRELCAQLERDAPGSSANEESIRGASTVTLSHPTWNRQLKLRLGNLMGLDDAIQYAAHEHGLKFRPARTIFLDYRKALNIR